MLTLTIETATNPGSVAVLDGPDLLASHSLDTPQSTAKSLAPTIKSLFSKAGRSLPELQLVTLIAGPGSFTGLRIGVTTAKMLGYAIGCPVVAVNTLDVIARQVDSRQTDRLEAVMNAQRKQLFVRRYDLSAGRWAAASDVSIQDIPTWIRDVESKPSIAITGPGLERIRPEQLQSIGQTGCQIVDASNWTPRAVTVARLGLERYERGEQDEIWTLTPAYYRKSYAE
jgi:tRNA threonylcarbamoyladenosine biosynthesis protein TsaB